MDFLLSNDLKDFRKSLRDFFIENFQESHRYLLQNGKRAESQISELKTLWKELLELGVLSAPLPESGGGLGMGLLSAAIILEESGRALAPLPLLESFTFAICPLRNGALLTQETTDKILSGELCITGCWSDFDATSAYRSSIETSDHEIRRDAASGAVSISSTAAMEKVFVQTIDLIRTFSPSGEPSSEKVSMGILSEEQWKAVRSEIFVLLTAELCGVGSKIAELTVEYAKTRKQFDAPIGSFQAIQHKLSDLHLAVETSTSLCRFAAWCADSSPEQFHASSLAAKSYAGEAIVRGIEQALQAHGGIGFTFEYSLHLYLRRAQLLGHLLGSSGDLALELASNTLAEARLP